MLGWVSVRPRYVPASICPFLVSSPLLCSDLRLWPNCPAHSLPDRETIGSKLWKVCLLILFSVATSQPEFLFIKWHSLFMWVVRNYTFLLLCPPWEHNGHYKVVEGCPYIGLYSNVQSWHWTRWSGSCQEAGLWEWARSLIWVRLKRVWKNGMFGRPKVRLYLYFNIWVWTLQHLCIIMSV